MGDAANEILSSMDLSEDDKKRYEPVKIKFDKHFARERNLIYKQANLLATANKMARLLTSLLQPYTHLLKTVLLDNFVKK